VTLNVYFSVLIDGMDYGTSQIGMLLFVSMVPTIPIELLLTTKV